MDAPLMPAAPRLQRMLAWSWAMVGSVSIRTKILGMVLALTSVLGLGVTWQVRQVMDLTFANELELRGESVVSDLAARAVDPILLNDSFALHQLLEDTVRNHPDLLYAFVVDPEGQVLAHTFGEAGFPMQLLALHVPEADGGIHHLLYDSNEGRVHDYAAPVYDGRAGVVRVGLTEQRLHAVVNTVTGQMLLTTLVVGLSGIAGAVFLTWLLTRPILTLVETTRRVGRGDLSARAPIGPKDEISALAASFNQMVSELGESHRALAEKEEARGRLLERVLSAQEEERKRIARELHDGVGQALGSILVGLKLISQAEALGEVRARSDDLRALTSENLEQVRLLSRQLRPSVLDDLGLAAALERHAAEFRQLYPGITVDLHCDLTNRLPASAATALYRIVQEAMTNAARHGSAETVSVLVTQRGSQVLAIVEDDGHGFDPVAARRAGRSVGIHGMSERAELLGGSLDIESSGEGTTIYASLPLDSTERDHSD